MYSIFFDVLSVLQKNHVLYTLLLIYRLYFNFIRHLDVNRVWSRDLE